MLAKYEEINLDTVLERAGLFRNEFEPSEYDALLYDNEVKERLNELISYDKDVAEEIHKLNKDDSSIEYLSAHKKYVETILRVKSKLADDSYKKVISDNKIDYKVERIIRKSDISYVLSKYFKNEPVNDELIELCSQDYIINFYNKYIIDKCVGNVPKLIEKAYVQRLNELDKYIPRK